MTLVIAGYCVKLPYEGRSCTFAAEYDVGNEAVVVEIESETSGWVSTGTETRLIGRWELYLLFSKARISRLVTLLLGHVLLASFSPSRFLRTSLTASTPSLHRPLATAPTNALIPLWNLCRVHGSDGGRPRPSTRQHGYCLRSIAWRIVNDLVPL